MALARQALGRLTQVPRLTSIRSLSITHPVLDKATHTGQQWDERDPRNARFNVTGLEKQVNDQFAIDLIAQVPPIVVSQRIVACDGGGGALGHPKVYINLDDGEPHSCIYCGLRYVYAAAADKDKH